MRIPLLAGNAERSHRAGAIFYRRHHLAGVIYARDPGATTLSAARSNHVPIDLRYRQRSGTHSRYQVQDCRNQLTRSRSTRDGTWPDTPESPAPDREKETAPRA